MQPEHIQSFSKTEEKKHFAMATSHNPEDLIELPNFMNVPSTQGYGSESENLLEDMAPDSDVPLVIATG